MLLRRKTLQGEPVGSLGGRALGQNPGRTRSEFYPQETRRFLLHTYWTGGFQVSEATAIYTDIMDLGTDMDVG